MTNKLQNSIKNQAVWFLLVGAAAAGVHFLVLITLVSVIQMSPALANVAAFFIAFGVSFFGHFYFTFNPAAAIDRGENNRNNSNQQHPQHQKSLSTASPPSITKINNNDGHHRGASNTLSPKKSAPLHSLIKWFLSSLLGFLANQALFLTGLHWFGQANYPLIWLIVTAMITVMTFALGKLWAFNHD